jgi:hypothetical protein
VVNDHLAVALRGCRQLCLVGGERRWIGEVVAQSARAGHDVGGDGRPEEGFARRLVGVLESSVCLRLDDGDLIDDARDLDGSAGRAVIDLGVLILASVDVERLELRADARRERRWGRAPIREGGLWRAAVQRPELAATRLDGDDAVASDPPLEAVRVVARRLRAEREAPYAQLESPPDDDSVAPPAATGAPQRDRQEREHARTIHNALRISRARLGQHGQASSRLACWRQLTRFCRARAAVAQGAPDAEVTTTV